MRSSKFSHLCVIARSKTSYDNIDNNLHIFFPFLVVQRFVIFSPDEHITFFHCIHFYISHCGTLLREINLYCTVFARLLICLTTIITFLHYDHVAHENTFIFAWCISIGDITKSNDIVHESNKYEGRCWLGIHGLLVSI